MPLRGTTRDENTLVGAVGANDCHSRASGNPTAALDALSFSRIPTFVGTGAGMRGHDGFGAYNDQFANNIL